jgi:autophagy-related protein 9
MHDSLLESRHSLIPPQRMDKFLKDLYAHFRCKGLKNIIILKMINLIMLVFIGFTYTILAHCVNFEAINDPYQSFLHSMTRINALTVIIWTVLGSMFIFRTVLFVDVVNTHIKIKQFYDQCLHIRQDELETIDWERVTNAIINIPNLCADKMTHTDIMSVIMRKENYLISMINLGIIDIPITETLEKIIMFSVFSINWSVIGVKDTHVDKRVWSDQLKKRLKLLGIIMIPITPIICVIYLLYVLLRYGEQIKENPSEVLGSRKWSSIGKWKLREINEAQHYFENRLRRAHYHAREYIEQFPTNSTQVLIARLVMFMSGVIFFIVLAMSIISHDFIFQIGYVSSVVYITVLMSLISVCRSLLPNEEQMTTPEEKMREVIKYTHYAPSKWQKRAQTHDVYDEFTKLFDYKVKIWFTELWSVITIPYICIKVLPKYCDRIVEFMSQMTSECNGVGNVCAYSVMNDLKYCSIKYGADVDAPKQYRLKHGKMEKSFLNFYLNYPSWEMPYDCQRLVARINEWDVNEQNKKRFDNGFGSTIFISANGCASDLQKSGNINLIHNDFRNTYKDKLVYSASSVSTLPV